jgi:hypothetical protein
MPDDDVNARGELSFAAQVRLTHGPCGAERLPETPVDDPWHDVPPGPPVLPEVDGSAWGRATRAARPSPPGT